jgi:hypothetical protein
MVALLNPGCLLAAQRPQRDDDADDRDGGDARDSQPDRVLGATCSAQPS